MEHIATLFIVLSAYMCGAFLASLVLKNNGIADIAYGGGFLLLTWISHISGLHAVGGFILTGMVTMWSARLVYRIFRKNFNKSEDFRYKQWRDAWGKSFIIRSFFQIYVLQGTIIAIIVSPVLETNLFSTTLSFTGFQLIGVFLWLFGFLFEAIGDMQLDRYIKNSANKGTIMMSGLWKYTRHPNYFGESVMWWAISFIAFGALNNIWGLYASIVFVSPVLITFLLLKVSGVPMLEERWKGNPLWEAYAAKTNVLIPWFRKK